MKIVGNIMRCWIFLCLIAGNISGWASKVEVPFNTLQHERILSVTSDKYGITWIGTSKGIFQYDGQSLYKYLRNNKEKSQMRSVVFDIFMSKDGILIAASNNGLYKYLPKHDLFQEQVSHIQFSSIVDRLADGSYFLLDNISQRAIIADSTLQKVLASVRLDEITSILPRFVRLSTGNYCIYGVHSFALISPQLKILKKVEVPAPIIRADETMERIIVGTENGYYTYSYEGNRVSNNTTLEQYTAGCHVDFIVQDTPYECFVGVSGKGIYYYNKNTDQIHLVSRSLDQRITNRELTLLQLDQNRQLWLGGNIDQPSIGLTLLKTRPTYPSFKELLVINDNNRLQPIELVAIDPKGTPYVFTTQDLYKYDQGKLNYIMPLPEKNCSDMLFDKQGRLWILSPNAIYIYSINDNGHPYLQKTVPEKGYRASMNVVTDDYITFSYPGRLVSFDTGFAMLQHVIPNGIPPYISLALNKRDIYLRLSYNYSASYNPFKGFWDEKTNPQTNNINCQLRDSRGEIWIATDNAGVIHANSDGTPIDTLDTTNSLPDNTVYEIAEDKSGNIWMTTTNGIAKYMPKTRQVHNYGEANGMLHDLRQGRMLKSPDGELYLYSSTHLLQVEPVDNLEASIAPKPLVKSALVNNTIFHGFPSSVETGHDENNLTIDFVSPDMMRGNLLQYEYRLEGHEHSWTAAGNNRSVVYNNLRPGNYRFQVRARYGDNPYSEVTELPIRIRPAFWQTVVFKLFVTLTVLTVTFLFVRNLLRTRIAIAESRFAVENERLKVELYSNLSHLIRTPVSLINAPFQELVEGHEWNSREQELIAVIRRSIDRILDITRQFLERWSDTDEQAAVDTTLRLEMKDLSAIVRETALMFRPTASQAGVNLSLEIPESLVALIDEDKIIKILYNLVSNALRHTPRGGEVKISVVRQGQTLAFSVADTGTGVSDELKKKIFERFFSPDNRSGYHFGIGLYHTRQLVQLQGGTVEVRDNKPRGAIFTITLPIEQAAVLPQSAHSLSVALPKEEAPDTAGLETDATLPHLLLVEDNEDMLSYLAASLRRKYHVSTARDGMEALDLFAKEGIDLVVTDVMMPRMDGYTLCRWVKESAEYCHIPVVILTAKSTNWQAWAAGQTPI